MNLPEIDLSQLKVIGWHGEFGMNWEEGTYWGDCPDCDEECLYDQEGQPTSIHRGQ